MPTMTTSKLEVIVDGRILFSDTFPVAIMGKPEVDKELADMPRLMIFCAANLLVGILKIGDFAWAAERFQAMSLEAMGRCIAKMRGPTDADHD
ncbi:hypothetical protein C4571_01975 [Candidatus Parcubacteria bacterium]|nr:MAG: hypothetical protein C4571_01975 [Candidatus Parcubacteria bacterium]